MSETRKRCPLTFHVQHTDATVVAEDCIANKCAWWSKECQECIVPQIAVGIKTIRERMPDF